MNGLQPPDCWIAASSSNSKTIEEIEQFYNETKVKAENRTKEILSSVDSKKEQEFDHLAKAILSHSNNTSPNINKEFEEFAKNLVSRVVQEQLDNPAIGKDGSVSFVLGPPAAGKSTIIESIKQNEGAYHADQDWIKEQLAKHYNVNINHPLMHAMSGVVMKNYMIGALLENKINFIQEKIGDNPEKMEKLIDKYSKTASRINVSLVHADIKVCQVRNSNRCLKKIAKNEIPRLVEYEALEECGNKPLMTYLYLINNCAEKLDICKSYNSDLSAESLGMRMPPQEMISLSLHAHSNEELLEYFQQGQSINKEIKKQVTNLLMQQLKKNDVDINYLKSQGLSKKDKEMLMKLTNQLSTKIMSPAVTYRVPGMKFDEKMVSKNCTQILNDEKYIEAINNMAHIIEQHTNVGVESIINNE